MFRKLNDVNDGFAFADCRRIVVFILTQVINLKFVSVEVMRII